MFHKIIGRRGQVKHGMGFRRRLARHGIRLLLLSGLAILVGCSSVESPTQAPVPTETSLPTLPQTETFTLAPTRTMPPTATDLPTQTPTETLTDVPTSIPTETLTPTPAIPVATVIEARAFCRYGPGKAYLYSHELNAGDIVQVDGRNYTGSWLWVQPADLARHCWTSAAVVEVSGDPLSAPVVQTQLPKSSLYGPPEDVEAERQGDTVVVRWSPVWMTEDDNRGYLIEALVCQGGGSVPYIVQTDETAYEFPDDGSCSGAGGRLYTVEKHGYTDPVEIPWP